MVVGGGSGEEDSAPSVSMWH